MFKFAGDALIIFWPENKDDSHESLTRRAMQCALRIQDHLNEAQLAPGVVLSVKMGIGVGGVTLAHLGGEYDGAVSRIEYIATGPAVLQAFKAESRAKAGHVVAAPEAWTVAKQFFTGHVLDQEGFVKVRLLVR